METEEIAEKIQKAGGKLYRVGGALRDRLLGLPVHDEDFCVTGITTQEFESIFPQAILRGKSFAVYDLEGKEIAFARKEKKTASIRQKTPDDGKITRSRAFHSL